MPKPARSSRSPEPARLPLRRAAKPGWTPGGTPPAKGVRAPSEGGSDAACTLESLRQLMQDFVRERQWEKFHTPRNLAASISIEAAELLEHFQWLTPEEAFHKSLHVPTFRQEVGEEMADVLLYLLSLANILHLDLTQTVQNKMKKNRLKYPANKFQGHYLKPLRK